MSEKSPTPNRELWIAAALGAIALMIGFEVIDENF